MQTCQACGGVLGRDCFNPEECMEITRQQAEIGRNGNVQQLQEQLDTAVRLLNKFQNELSRFAAYAATCKGENTSEWMQGLVERINDACKALGDPDRFKYRDTRGVDWIEHIRTP